MENEKTRHEHDGHRQRMLQKLKKQELSVQERLEILLFSVLPRRNTADVAHRLLSRFGRIENLFSASMAELAAIEGVGENAAAYLYNIGALFRAMQKPKTTTARTKKAFAGEFSTEKFLPYVNETCKNERDEFVAIFLLDENANIFKTHRFEGDEEHVTFAPEKVAELILDYHPSGLVMVHNHLDENENASKADEETTKKVQLICSMHNVIFCDHIIYSKQGVYSYYMDGRLQDISNDYSMRITKAREEEENV